MDVSSPDLQLVPLQKKHSEATLSWMNDPELMRLLHREHVISREEHEAWFHDLAGDPGRAYFAIETLPSHEHVGNIWLVDIDRRNAKAEVRILLGISHGRGVGSSAMNHLARQAFGPMGLNRIYAYVLAFNLRAKRAFEKAGFREEGLLRQDRKCADGYVDAFLMARLSHEL